MRNHTWLANNYKVKVTSHHPWNNNKRLKFWNNYIKSTNRKGHKINRKRNQERAILSLQIKDSSHNIWAQYHKSNKSNIKSLFYPPKTSNSIMKSKCHSKKTMIFIKNKITIIASSILQVNSIKPNSRLNGKKWSFKRIRSRKNISKGRYKLTYLPK